MVKNGDWADAMGKMVEEVRITVEDPLKPLRESRK